MESTFSADNKFQAIGTLFGPISKHPEMGWSISVQGKFFRLFIPPIKYKGWLKEMAARGENCKLFLLVYPRVVFFPDKNKEPLLYFIVVSWNTVNNWERPGTFLLRGLWQQLPQSRVPVLSIYRNKGSQDHLKKFKAAHLPVLMRRDDCKPYRFNPKETEKSLVFVQGLFVLLPHKAAFGYSTDLLPPSTNAPSYIKPVKPFKSSTAKKKNQSAKVSHAKPSEFVKPKLAIKVGKE